LRFGNDDETAVAARIADVREADAGVARSALDHGAAGFQCAALLGVADDPERGAILHRAAGIQELRLAEDLAAGLAAHALEADERRIADGVGEILTDVHRTVKSTSAKRADHFTVRVPFMLGCSVQM